MQRAPAWAAAQARVSEWVTGTRRARQTFAEAPRANGSWATVHRGLVQVSTAWIDSSPSHGVPDAPLPGSGPFGERVELLRRSIANQRGTMAARNDAWLQAGEHC